MAIYNNASLNTLASVLGTSPNLRLVCTSTAINKMAEKKPSHSGTNGPITDAERRLTDVSQGIFYGLRVGLKNSNLANIHLANWDYAGRPTGGIGTSPYRQLDFNGYDTNAQPEFYGDMPTTAYSNLDEPFSIQLSNRNTSGTGVSESKVILGNVDYSQLYLCVAINGYATQLVNSTMRGYYPVLHNSTWGKIFTCPALPSTLQGAGNKTVTVFFATYNDASQMQGKWISTSKYTAFNYICSLAYCANKTISFSEISTIPEVITSFTASVSGSRITYSWATGKDWSSYNKRIVITLSQITGGKENEASTSTVTAITSGTSQSYYLSDLVMEAGWFGGMGDTYKAMALFQYYSGNQWNTAMYTSTSFTY